MFSDLGEQHQIEYMCIFIEVVEQDRGDKV